VTFLGEDITKVPPHKIVARGLGHVPEGRMIFSNLTVDENLAMGAYLQKDKAAIARNRDYVFGIFPRLKERSARPRARSPAASSRCWRSAGRSWASPSS
jgi:branched-chain amino acid transport system ATP-binding protein